MRKFKVHAFTIFVSTALFAGAVFFFQTPIQSLHTKFLAVLLGTLTVILPAIKWPVLRWPVAVVGLLCVLPLFMPGRKPDVAELRTAYVARMLSYQSVPYIWGGETSAGLDCSGLIRRAWMQTLFSKGLTTRNPSLLREAALVWWQDCTAREMMEGYRGRTHPVMSVESLNEMSPAGVQPGDLAVTASGVHILANVAQNAWVQADPNKVNGGDKVVVTRSPSNNGWFNMKVVVCRWRMLDD